MRMTALFWGSNPMRLAQLAGIAMTAVVVTGVDLPVGWAMTVGVLAGALTTFLVTLILERGRG
jgi:hypothetical protein